MKPRPRLVVMVKEPRPGRVKTRLAEGIGHVRAAWWYRHQTVRLMRRLRSPRWDLILAVSPDAEGMASRVWPVDVPRFPQGRGDLGARMARVLRVLGPGPVLIVGSDIPGLTAPHVARGFAALARVPTIIGPAPDGGYWALGSRGPLPTGALAGVRWSTAHARADTMASLGGRPVALIDELADVDEPGDLA